MKNKGVYYALIVSLLVSFGLGMILVLNGDENAKNDVWFVPIIFIQILTAYNYVKVAE